LNTLAAAVLELSSPAAENTARRDDVSARDQALAMS